jgi:hypothetical protein
MSGRHPVLNIRCRLLNPKMNVDSDFACPSALGTLPNSATVGWTVPQIIDLDSSELGSRGRQQRCLPAADMPP